MRIVFVNDTMMSHPIHLHGMWSDLEAEKEKASQQPKEPIPALTDADRAAAFPPNLDGHAVHDKTINYMVLFDQVEWRGTDGGGGANWENTSWGRPHVGPQAVRNGRFRPGRR